MAFLVKQIDKNITVKLLYNRILYAIGREVLAKHQTSYLSFTKNVPENHFAFDSYVSK